MIRFMLDSDNVAALDPVAELCATYADLVQDPAALQAKLGKSRLVLIDRGLGDLSGEASVFDVERGALTPAAAVSHYDVQHTKGVKYLTVYVNRDNMASVRQEFGTRNPYFWVATLDGTSHIAGIRAMHGPAAIQCLSASDTGIHADGSLVFENTWNPTGPTNPSNVEISEAEGMHAAAISLAARLDKLTAQLRG